jgi:hypothetical protein
MENIKSIDIILTNLKDKYYSLILKLDNDNSDEILELSNLIDYYQNIYDSLELSIVNKSSSDMSQNNSSV